MRDEASNGGAGGGAKDAQPSVAVLFATSGATVGVVHKCASVAAARAKCVGLADETECCVRVSSDAGDGVLFPPPPEDALANMHAAVAAKRIPAPPKAKPVPQNVVVVDVAAAPTKRKPLPWQPRVLGFASAKSAATFALHCYRTAGPRLKSLEWHAFDGGGSEASPRMQLFGATGAFNMAYAITDIAALDAAAQAPK